MMSGRTILLGIVTLVLLVHTGSWLVDYTHARTVQITVHQSPRLLPADGVSQGTVVVRVTEANGTPRVGDSIEILNLTSQGTFDHTRAATDRQGRASFIYTTSMFNIYQPAGPIGVLVTDTSLGKLIEVDRDVTGYMHTIDPAKYKKVS